MLALQFYFCAVGRIIGMLVRGVTGLSFNISFPYFWVRVFVIRPIAQSVPEFFDELVGFSGFLHVLRCEH